MYASQPDDRLARHDPPEQQAAPPRRRRTRVWILLILFAALAGWAGLRVVRAQRQAEAGNTVRQLKGYLIYDYLGGRTTEPAGPMWLRNILGDEYFVTVTEVHVGGLSEKQIAQVADATEGLYGLKSLYLENLRIGDPVVEHLTGLDSLKRLYVHDAILTPEGLAKLKKELPQTQVVGQ